MIHLRRHLYECELVGGKLRGQLLVLSRQKLDDYFELLNAKVQCVLHLLHAVAQHLHHRAAFYLAQHHVELAAVPGLQFLARLVQFDLQATKRGIHLRAIAILLLQLILHPAHDPRVLQGSRAGLWRSARAPTRCATADPAGCHRRTHALELTLQLFPLLRETLRHGHDLFPSGLHFPSQRSSLVAEALGACLALS
eukprot:scaffold1610_cov257-Pinguiococcus_pyrenoidosus.AAC.3